MSLPNKAIATSLKKEAVQFYNLNAQYKKIAADVQARLQVVLDHGGYVMGAEVAELEAALADYVGVSHCIAVSSGTDALLMALMALAIKPGDEVITSPFSFIAVVEMALLLGAVPVFVDIDPRTYNLDPSQLEAAITPKTRAIVPVSLYGQPADYVAINVIAEKHNIPVIDDMAQSFGATAHGRRAGSLAPISCVSFYPTKPLGCYGDGGACFTDDQTLAQALRQLRDHGQSGRYHHTRLGINGRLDTMQAAVLLAKLAIFDEEVEARQRLGKYYNEQLEQAPVVLPYVSPSATSVYAQYTIQIDHRDDCQRLLKAQNIPTAVHYPTLLPMQPICGNLTAEAAAQKWPVAYKACQRVLSLPMNAYMNKAEVAYVASAIKGLLF